MASVDIIIILFWFYIIVFTPVQTVCFKQILIYGEPLKSAQTACAILRFYHRPPPHHGWHGRRSATVAEAASASSATRQKL